jgi:hypothetical protein
MTVFKVPIKTNHISVKLATRTTHDIHAKREEWKEAGNFPDALVVATKHLSSGKQLPANAKPEGVKNTSPQKKYSFAAHDHIALSEGEDPIEGSEKMSANDQAAHDTPPVEQFTNPGVTPVDQVSCLLAKISEKFKDDDSLSALHIAPSAGLGIEISNVRSNVMPEVKPNVELSLPHSFAELREDKTKGDLQIRPKLAVDRLATTIAPTNKFDEQWHTPFKVLKVETHFNPGTATSLPTQLAAAIINNLPDRPVETAVLANGVIFVPKPGMVKSLHIQLQPENLGELKVLMHLHGKELTLKIEASSQEALAILSKDHQALKDLVTQAGYEIADASISISLRVDNPQIHVLQRDDQLLTEQRHDGERNQFVETGDGEKNDGQRQHQKIESARLEEREFPVEKNENMFGQRGARGVYI